MIFSAQPLPLIVPRRETMTADDFMLAENNSEAARWAFETSPDAWGASALLLYGPCGCGKTHLVSAWLSLWGGVALTCGDARLEELVTGGFNPSALALDNADAVAGDAAAEEWLQHLYNAARAARIPLLLTAQQASSAWGLQLKDIASRLNSCPAIAIGEPDDVLVRGLLLKQFADRQLLVEDGVIEYLARRLERTGAAVRNAVAHLDEASLATRSKITIPFVQSVLGF